MNPGKLNRRIVLQKRTLTKDSTGSRVQTWSDHATVWAEQIKQSGKAAGLADSDANQDARQFRIRYRAIDATNYRILYQSKFFTLAGITEEGVKTTIILDALASQPASAEP